MKQNLYSRKCKFMKEELRIEVNLYVYQKHVVFKKIIYIKVWLYSNRFPKSSWS